MPYFYLIAIVHSSCCAGVFPAINTVFAASNANLCSGVDTTDGDFIGSDHAG